MSDADKVVLELKAVGDAPRLKSNKFKIQRGKSFAEAQSLLRRQLQLSDGDSLFLYCSSSFRPNLSDSIGDLFDVSQTSCFDR